MAGGTGGEQFARRPDRRGADACRGACLRAPPAAAPCVDSAPAHTGRPCLSAWINTGGMKPHGGRSGCQQGAGPRPLSPSSKATPPPRRTDGAAAVRPALICRQAGCPASPPVPHSPPDPFLPPSDRCRRVLGTATPGRLLHVPARRPQPHPCAIRSRAPPDLSDYCRHRPAMRRPTQLPPAIHLASPSKNSVRRTTNKGKKSCITR